MATLPGLNIGIIVDASQATAGFQQAAQASTRFAQTAKTGETSTKAYANALDQAAVAAQKVGTAEHAAAQTSRLAAQATEQAAQAARGKHAALTVLNNMLSVWGGRVNTAIAAQQRLTLAQRAGAITAEQAARIQGLITAAFGQQAAAASRAAAALRASSGATAGAGRGMGLMRFQVQNAAFQIQDFVVQVTSGTSALRAFSQQAPQLLGGFGPVGAVLGVVAALSAAVAGAFFGVARASKDVDAAVKSLDATFSSHTDNLDDVITKYRELTAEQRAFERASLSINLQQLEEQLRKNGEAAEQAIDDFLRAGEGLTRLGTILGTDISVVNPFAGLDPELEKTVEGLRKTAQSFGEFATSVAELRESAGAAASKELITLDDSLRALFTSQVQATEAADKLRERLGLLETGAADAARTTKELDEATKHFNKTVEASLKIMTDVARDRAKAAKDAERFGQGKIERQNAELAAIAERTIRAGNQARFAAVKASERLTETLGDQLQLQTVLLRGVDAESEEYRVQVRLLQAKRQAGGEITAEQERQIRQLEQQATIIDKQADIRKEAERQAERAQEVMEQPFITALENIQSSFADTFETIFSGGVSSFSDLAGEIKRIFIRLAAEIAALMVIRPVLASAAGAAGISGFAGAAAPSLASQLGPAAGAPLVGAHGMLTGGQGQALGPAAGLLGSTGFLGSNITGGQALLAGGLGAAGGSIIGGFAGSSTGGGIGGGLGATAGALIGSVVPGIGTVAGGIVGGLVGSFAGGFLGGLFGGGDSGHESGIAGGQLLGKITGSGKPAAFARSFDQKLIQLLDARQEQIANAMLKGAAGVRVKFGEELSANDIASLAAGRIGPIAQGLGFKATAITGARGSRFSAEEQLQKLAQAIDIKQRVDDLTSGFGAFRSQARELSRQFDQLAAAAKEFGISFASGTARRAAGFDLISAQLANLGGVTVSFDDQLNALNKEFYDVRQVAYQFGFSITEVKKAQEEATKALKAQQQAQINALALSVIAPFEQLLAPLEAFQTQLKFADLNPLQQFEAAQKDFERIANLARAGSTIAIGQLQGAGELFIRLAEQVGASPGGVSARAEVGGVIESVMQDLKKAQAEASKGLEDVIKRASRDQIDTLDELKVEVRRVGEEIKKLRRT